MITEMAQPGTRSLAIAANATMAASEPACRVHRWERGPSGPASARISPASRLSLADRGSLGADDGTAVPAGDIHLGDDEMERAQDSLQAVPECIGVLPDNEKILRSLFEITDPDPVDCASSVEVGSPGPITYLVFSTGMSMGRRGWSVVDESRRRAAWPGVGSRLTR